MKPSSQFFCSRSAAFLCWALVCLLSVSLAAEDRSPQEGTITRMRMTDCISTHHVFMNTMSGAAQATDDQCPEYVLVAANVVYVIVGKSSDQLVPLAETTRFHFRNNEVLIRVDDARRESRFHVKAMVLRPEWDRSQQIAEAAAMAAMRNHIEGGVVMDARQ